MGLGEHLRQGAKRATSHQAAWPVEALLSSCVASSETRAALNLGAPTLRCSLLQPMDVQMTTKPLLAILLCVTAAVSFAQTAAPANPAPAQATATAASAPEKHKLLKKLKNHKPGAPATNPETSPDKKGGA
jgi:hypothetical protein